ncbi:MAG TPA: flagellar basal body rod protein FlgB [Bacillales bacterium]|nr:flagellar basal body rod protein FlgB [Bacillales bacterium]
MEWFSNQIISGLETALNRTSLREKTISQNIANVDTPNYKAKRVVFKDEFDRELQARRTNPRHVPFSTATARGARVLTESGTTINNNGNNVDMDKEMASLAKNQIKYQAYVTRLNSEFRQLKLVLKGGN